MDQTGAPYKLYKYYTSMKHSGADGHDNFFLGCMGAIAGGTAGAVECSILYPGEYLKTQLQLEKTKKNKKYGIIECARKTIKHRGVLGLYRGMSVLLLGTIPRAAARFGCFEYLKSYFPLGHTDNTKNLFCGLGAGCFEAVIIVTPLETIKVKFVNDQRRAKPQLKGFFHGIRAILREYGIRGVYRGLTATVLKEGSSSAIRFGIVEYLKEYYKGDDPDKNVPKLYVGVYGAIAGFASVMANTPIDVVQTRLQSFEGHKYKTTLDCFIQIFRKEGFFALYRGTVIRIYLVCSSMGISFMAYDAIMERFDKIF